MFCVHLYLEQLPELHFQILVANRLINVLGNSKQETDSIVGGWQDVCYCQMV